MKKIYLYLLLAMVFAGLKTFSQTLTISGNLSPFTTCESSSSNVQSFTIAGTGLTSNINITAPSGLGFLVSLNGSSFVPSISLTPSSGVVTATTIYVSLVGITSPGNVSGNITCTSAGATTQSIPVSGTVNPRPDVDPISNQTLCRNATTTAVNFSGTIPGTIYNWTNSDPAIGLPASGTGNIASFTAANSTNAPITSTVTVTPRFGTAIPEILYYKFDGSGPTAPNLASNPPAGTAVGTFNGNAFQGIGGVCNGSLQTTSTNSTSSDYFVTGWNASLNNTSWTLSFIASGFPSSGGAFFVMGSQIATPFQVSYSIINGGFNFSLDGSNPISMQLTGTTGPSTKTITIVYDDIIKEVRAYVNGTLSASQSATLNQGNLNFSGFNIGDIVGGFLGIRGSSSIDEVRMYSRALSVAEIQALVNSCDGGGVCTGSPETFDITVYPDLAVDDPADQTVCAGSATTAVNFTGTSGAIYNWTNNNPSIGLAASGTGNIPSFTPTFSGTSPITATVTVTPSFSGGPACTSSSQTFTITVNPIPDVNNVANQTVCNNAATAAINFSGTVPGTNYTWTNSNPSIGLPASGSGNIPSFTAVNTGGSPVTSTITVTPIFASCTDSPEIFGITVNPSPVVNPITNQNVCTGNNTTAINFTSNVAGATFSWTNSNPSIGLAASGTGNITSFTAINAGTTTETATITVIPVDPSTSCPGTPETFTISISPVPTGTGTPSSQIICSADAINTIAFTGNVPSITFDWTRDNLAAVTGIPGVGNGSISGTLTNTTNALVTVTFTVTPSIGGCVGTPFTVTVDVRPQFLGATVSPTSQTICSNNAIVTITPSGPVAGTTYTWVRDNTTAVTGIAASGSGNISGSLINTTALPVTVTFTITPISPFGCIGTPITSSVLVNPRPNAIATPVNQQVCNGVNIVPIALTSSTPGTTFTWTRDNTVSVPGGIPSSGSGSTISGFMINATNAPVTVTFTITPTANGCVGATTTATVLVYPTATAVATPATQTSCSGLPITNINLSGPVANTVFSWTRDNVANATGIPASGTGNISGTLTTTATTPVLVTFTIIPSINGCAGPAITATDTVKPTPTVNQPLDQALCNGAATTAVTFNSAVSGTTFNWTNNTPSIGLAASGTGNIPSFTAINTTSVQVNAIITVTPTAAGCAGMSRTFVIRVNPTAVVNTVSNQVLCTGSATNAVNFTGPVAGTTYSWTNSNTSIGLAASGIGNIPSFTAINNTPNAVTATITVTPNSPAGCVGASTTFTITVNGNSLAPTGATSSVIANCGPTTTTLSVQGGALGTGASWKWYAGSCGGGASIGTGATLNNVPVNATTTFFVRAEGTCNTTACASITVVINEVPTISIVAAPYTALTPLLKTNLTSTVTPIQSGNVIEWFKDNSLSPISTGASLNNINVDQVGSYRAKITTAQGCTATSNIVDIRDSVTSQLFVYPNPNNGQFKIRYFIPDNVLSIVRKVVIFDSKGSLVYNQRISVSTRWGAMDINIKGAAKGSYFIKILDVNENEIIGSRVQVIR